MYILRAFPLQNPRRPWFRHGNKLFCCNDFGERSWAKLEAVPYASCRLDFLQKSVWNVHDHFRPTVILFNSNQNFYERTSNGIQHRFRWFRSNSSSSSNLRDRRQRSKWLIFEISLDECATTREGIYGRNPAEIESSAKLARTERVRDHSSRRGAKAAGRCRKSSWILHLAGRPPPRSRFPVTQ